MDRRTFLSGLALACCAGCISHQSELAVGSKNFTEQLILGEILKQYLGSVCRMPAEGRFYLAGTYICQQAILAGRIDAYVEYTGTALTAVLKQPLDRDPQSVLNTIRRLYASRFNITVEDPLGFENTFAMVVRGDDAHRLHLTTLSEAAKYTPDWRLGVGYEFEQRPDGLPGLSKAYGLKFAAAPRTMDLGLLYRALEAHQVDMIAANSTDGPIQALGLVALQDDRHYFPPYQAVPLVREEALQRWPQMQVALDALAGRVTADDMRAMNEAIDGQHRDPAEVVREFRQKHGL
jgi:osmoprotectant transport system substrate-binding protein